MKYANRVKQTTTTTGTGPYTLEGTVPGFRTFIDGVGIGNKCFYCVTDGKNWEIGQGLVQQDQEYYSTPEPVLVREVIENSSNNDLPVNWLYSPRPMEISVVITEGVFQDFDATIDGLIAMVQDHPAMVAQISDRLNEIETLLNQRTEGKSAYEVAVELGFEGTRTDWLNSLKGAVGEKGAPGRGIPAGGTPDQLLVKNSSDDYDTKWMDVPFGMYGSTFNWGPQPIRNGNGLVGTNITNTTTIENPTVGNQLRLSAHVFPSSVRLERLSFDLVTTGHTGETAKVGIWRYTGENVVGELLAESGNIELSTTGIKSFVLSQPVDLQAGIYWIGLITDSYSAVIRSYEPAHGNSLAGGVDIRGYGYNALRIDHTGWKDTSLVSVPATGTVSTMEGVYVVMMNMTRV